MYTRILVSYHNKFLDHFFGILDVSSHLVALTGRNIQGAGYVCGRAEAAGRSMLNNARE